MAEPNFIPLLDPRQSGLEPSHPPTTTDLMGCEIEDTEETGMLTQILSALPVVAASTIGVLMVLLVVYLLLKLKEMRVNIAQMDKVLLGHTKLIFPSPNIQSTMRSEKTCSTRSLISPTTPITARD